MAEPVSFKVYMSTEDDESSKEIRHFEIKADLATDFCYLREKLQTIFPTLRDRHFIISWKDSDGDDIVITNDEELKIALNKTASCDTRKLYVNLRSEYSSSENLSDSASSEAYITCDGCDQEIQGIRYKCIQCANYDLCRDCERRDIHPEHCKIRLSVNPTTPMLDDLVPIRIDLYCDICGKELQGISYKCVVCANYDLCNDCQSRGMHPEHWKIRCSVNPKTQISSDSKPIEIFDCNVCYKDITGVYYECIQCENYDLCDDCEDLGMHPEHCLIRMSVPS